MPACQRPSCRSLRCLCRSLCLLLAHSHFKCPVPLLQLLPCWTVSFQIHGWPGPTWSRCICNNKYAYATCLVLLLRHGASSPQGSLHLHLGSRSLNIRTLPALPGSPGPHPDSPATACEHSSPAAQCCQRVPPVPRAVPWALLLPELLEVGVSPVV